MKGIVPAMSQHSLSIGATLPKSKILTSELSWLTATFSGFNLGARFLARGGGPLHWPSERGTAVRTVSVAMPLGYCFTTQYRFRFPAISMRMKTCVGPWMHP
eukprot:CAMPEP_0115567614 /NCGR_PEP_ID=MMETSP0271-20121206/104199_1 /TAXON_ID=71861 /ORGANISM="Scrippsiella trochoidea, Strain CCMP3099" /LENGTH=101 /DNA_ID=CAMNT_0003001975 /DNA_START=56 /DNA_END=362 /DNA_ORIENTATION=-